MRLEIFAQSDCQFSGITVAPDGRMFAPFQREPGSGIPTLGELHEDRSVTPYPDEAWNAWMPGDDPASAFVGVVSVRIGPDGLAWVVDKGSSGFIAQVVPDAAKLVAIDTERNRVKRIYPLGDVVSGMGLLDDVRFNGRQAYVTDAINPGLVVLDLESGDARRVLEDDPSTTGRRHLRADGRELRDPYGNPVTVHCDQLEVSPDGRLLYFQPTTGPMSVVETRFLDDVSLSPEMLSSHVRLFADTKSTGGTAMDANGNIYWSNTDECAIGKITPDGTMTEILRDERLQWPDAMWIAENGDLLAPAAQLNLSAGLNNGKDATRPPFTVYRMKLGLEPLRR